MISFRTLKVTLAETNWRDWVHANARMVINAGTLVGTMVLTSVLGLGYWWLASQYYTTEQVGIASAAVSAMLLLAEVSVLGFSTLLIGEISRSQTKAASMITSAASIVAMAGGVLGVLFALIAPYLSDDLTSLGSSVPNVAAFAFGVSLTSIGFVVDYSTIGMNRGELQLWRNVIFSILKFGVLMIAAIGLSSHTGISIVATWTISSLVSLLIALGFALLREVRLADFRPDWSLLRDIRGTAIGHHVLNLTYQGPMMMLPMLVTVLLSATVTASFYISWMFMSFVLLIPTSLAMSLYASVAKEPETMQMRMRLSLGLSTLVGIGANLGLLIVAGPILSIFGEDYVNQAKMALHILSLGVFPHIIIVHYIAIARIQKNLRPAAILSSAGMVFQLSGVIIGASVGGTDMLSVGFVVGLMLMALPILPVIYRAAFLAPEARITLVKADESFQQT